MAPASQSVRSNTGSPARPGEGTLVPRDESDLAAIVADAVAQRTPLAIAGGDTRAGLGRPVQAAATVSTRSLTGITLYEPTEMVISARAGTPLFEIEAALATHNQMLPFEPIDHRSIFGSMGEPTIGGLVAVNASGPRRVQAGAARDSLLGVRAVTGRGEAIKAGGRVMKNVTGIDLPRALAGSFGTLAVLTEATFRVLPVSETEATLVFDGLEAADAIRALSSALGSPFSVSAAAHLPAADGALSRTLLRIEGFAPSVADRGIRLAQHLAEFGPAETLTAGASSAEWAAIRDVTALSADRTRPLWRISVKPTDAPVVVAAIARAADARFVLDWGGGLIWVAVAESSDAGAAAIRRTVAGNGGHATLVRGTDAVRHSVEVFEPQTPAIMALSRSLKRSFDPAGILNPGRMYAGV